MQTSAPLTSLIVNYHRMLAVSNIYVKKTNEMKKMDKINSITKYLR